MGAAFVGHQRMLVSAAAGHTAGAAPASVARHGALHCRLCRSSQLWLLLLPVSGARAHRCGDIKQAEKGPVTVPSQNQV